MRKSKYYRQCGFKRGNRYTTAWVMEGLKVGNIVSFKSMQTDFDNWEVISVGDIRLTEAEVYDRSIDYKRTREASDI